MIKIRLKVIARLRYAFIVFKGDRSCGIWIDNQRVQVIYSEDDSLKNTAFVDIYASIR